MAAVIDPVVAGGISLLKPITDSLMAPVTRYLGYMVSCKRYVRDMHLKMSELDAARSVVEDRKNRNIIKHLHIPSQVGVWLEKVGNIKKIVDNFERDVGSCFNFKIRHKLGKEAFKIIEEIESLTREHSLLLNNWTDDQIRLGDVGPSTSIPSTHHHEFESRERTFKEALKVLHPNHRSHMVALCGMAGVGKTTMMQDLKKVVKEERMFSFIIEAVLGEKTDPIAIQQAVADYFGINLNEKTTLARVERLRKCFELQSDQGKNKILVILDDVWETVDLNDIGLPPLPNKDVDFKVLLTSRNKDVCTRIGVNTTSIIDVKPLTDPEAQELFCKIIKYSDDVDLDSDFHRIGDRIASKCQGLPIAIKTIACNLRGQRKEAWDMALSCLELGDTDDIVHKVFDMSYKNLKNETSSVFLLCGLYPEDFNIPTEDLMRYCWGLKLLEKVYSINQARKKINTCIEQLIHANLLIGTPGAGWVKMHDLVRFFVLSIISKDEHPSIVNHGNMVKWPATSESFKRLSLTCKGIYEFPGEYTKYPNLTLLKIMFGDNLLRHTQDFYEGMENLQVIAIESTHYLAFSRSLQCSTSLRTLCLDDCSLTFDYSIIGDLLSLEVLSFARSRIRKLPSMIGNLKKLKLLDLTGCDNLYIDSGVFNGLDKLEELYARVRDTNDSGRVIDDRKAISFSDGSSNDLAECLKKLSALEVELFENNAQLMDISFEKLERFNISLRCFSKNMGENLLQSENKLMLVTSKGELLRSGMNKLFMKTKVLYLQVSDMNDLQEVDVDAISLCPPVQSFFFNLRFLTVSRCEELRYIFTPRVASALSKLKDLEISSCPNLEMLIDFKNSGPEKITFPKLKRLILRDLMKLSSLTHTSNVIELPQLIELELDMLPKITDIYPENKLATSSMSSNTVQSLLKEEVVISTLKNIKVENCDSLVNLFPINPMPLLCSLKELIVANCDSIEVLFNLDLGCFNEIEGKSSLRRISGHGLKKLKEVWRVKGVNNSNLPIHSFQALESLRIEDCGSFRNLFTPTTVNFDLRALTTKMKDKSKKETKSDASSSRELGNNQQALLLHNLKHIVLNRNEEMPHVWKWSDWNKFSILQPPNSPFHNLTSIYMFKCNRIKYLFSPVMFKLFINLKTIRVEGGDDMEEIVSNRDDENKDINSTSISTYTNSTSFPLIGGMQLLYIENLRRIGGGAGGTLVSRTTSQDAQVDVPLWSLCQYSINLRIDGCYALSSLIPAHAVRHLQNLESLTAYCCIRVTDVFETESANNTTTGQRFPNMIVVPQLYNLKRLWIRRFKSLRYLLTFSTLESLKQLRELEIKDCVIMQVIVKEEDGADTSKVVPFPCLKSLKLIDLPNLMAFFKGMNEFRWHLLEEVEITRCPKMTRFTHGHSTSPMLKYIKTDFGKYSPACGLNFDMTTALQETPFLSIVDHTTLLREPWSFSDSIEIQLPRVPWSFSDLIQIHIDGGYRSSELIQIYKDGGLDYKKNVFVSKHEWLQLKKLQNIQGSLEEVFQAFSGSNEPLPAVINLPKLKEMDVRYLPRLECILKSNQHTILEFPNLTRLSIWSCESLGYVLSCSMVGSLLRLEELKIDDCSSMKAIVKEEEECDAKAKNQIVFPYLKSLSLYNLPDLEGFCLGCHDFQWPSLLSLEINHCPSLKVFTSGKSTAPKLKLIDTDFGTFDAKEDPNTILSTIQKARGTQIGKQLIRALIH